MIDDKLMRHTLRATGLKTMREAVDKALRTLLHLAKQSEMRRPRGKLDWGGDLKAMRSDNSPVGLGVRYWVCADGFAVRSLPPVFLQP